MNHESIKQYIPPRMLDCYRDFQAKKKRNKARKIIQQNRDLVGKYQNEDCYIIATGPSIMRQNLRLLEGRHCITVSNFFVHQDFNLIKPICHCIAPYHLPITEEAWVEWIADMRAHIETKETSIVLCLDDFDRTDHLLGELQRFYLAFGASSQYVMRNGIDLLDILLSPLSVSVQAIQLAIGLGFKRIFLLGCDHDWILHLGHSRHFYAEEKDAKVRNNYSEWSIAKDIGGEFASLSNLWRQYRLFKRITGNKVEIINLTEGGLLDVFPCADFEAHARCIHKN